MFRTECSGRQYEFFEDRLAVNGVPISYGEMSNITHRQGEVPAFLFDYRGRRFVLPYQAGDLKEILPFLLQAEKMGAEAEAEDLVLEDVVEPVMAEAAPNAAAVVPDVAGVASDIPGIAAETVEGAAGAAVVPAGVIAGEAVIEPVFEAAEPMVVAEPVVMAEPAADSVVAAESVDVDEIAFQGDYDEAEQDGLDEYIEFDFDRSIVTEDEDDRDRAGAFSFDKLAERAVKEATEEAAQQVLQDPLGQYSYAETFTPAKVGASDPLTGVDYANAGESAADIPGTDPGLQDAGIDQPFEAEPDTFDTFRADGFEEDIYVDPSDLEPYLSDGTGSTLGTDPGSGGSPDGSTLGTDPSLGSTGGSALKTGLGLSLKSKLIAGAAALVLAGGIGAAAVHNSNNSNEATDVDAPAVTQEEQAALPEETEEGAPGATDAAATATTQGETVEATDGFTVTDYSGTVSAKLKKVYTGDAALNKLEDMGEAEEDFTENDPAYKTVVYEMEVQVLEGQMNGDPITGDPYYSDKTTELDDCWGYCLETNEDKDLSGGEVVMNQGEKATLYCVYEMPADLTDYYEEVVADTDGGTIWVHYVL